MQEIGLKKGDFSETLVSKMSKEPQPPLKGLIGPDHFRQIMESKDVPDSANQDDEFGLHDIID